MGTSTVRRRAERWTRRGLLGGLFAGAFTWPILVWESPAEHLGVLVRHLVLCVAAACVVSLGDHDETADWEELEKHVGDV
ncbi:MAG TPA: hypothetical protein VER33_20520 [Polyangiaceae bacterium]|nr:hypothetical protein [Polyangiaceae bacterium]